VQAEANELADARWLLDVSEGGRIELPMSALLAERLPEVKAILAEHGAVVLRGLSPLSDVPAELATVATHIAGHQPVPYHEQSSPRTEVGDRVFTATDYPKHAELFLHNELSYAQTWPRFLIFHCAQPAEQGGATMLADCREVLERVPEEIRAAFAVRSWKYVRNLRASAGLSWQLVFQTTSRDDVEAYCASSGVVLQWTNDGARISAVRPATLELAEGSVWFNHIAAFHLSTLPDDVARSLHRLYAAEDLPVNTYFGDDGPIADDVVEAIRVAYRQATVDINWQRGDLAVIDNQKVAHGRRAYLGSRKVFVVLAGGTGRRDEGDL
jgi:alpha-ketoglutarate-dependent taurine dioxygenase